MIRNASRSCCQKNWIWGAATSSNSYNCRRSLCQNSESLSSSLSKSSYHLSGGPSHMHGFVFWEPNKPLSIEDFHMPRPKAGEILIKTKGKFFLQQPMQTCIYTYILHTKALYYVFVFCYLLNIVMRLNVQQCTCTHTCTKRGGDRGSGCLVLVVICSCKE